MSRGLTIMKSGWYTAIPYAVTVAGCLLLSVFADRLFSREAIRAGKRRYAVALFLVLSAVILATPMVQSTTLIIVLFSASMLFSACAMSWNFALVNDLLQSSADTGKAFAIFTLGGNAFGIVAPILTGYIVAASGSFDAAFSIAGVLALVGAALVLFLAKSPLGVAPGRTGVARAQV
jgi:ACS family glucarate transporter-like MFS transporter